MTISERLNAGPLGSPGCDRLPPEVYGDASGEPGFVDEAILDAARALVELGLLDTGILGTGTSEPPSKNVSM